MVAIFHEGNSKKTHDNELIKLLIKNLGLEIEQIKFFGMGNKSNFFKKNNDNYKELLLDIKREEIDKVLLIADADYLENDHKFGGYENTKKELKIVIKALDIESISDIYITCDPNDKCGYLESLILSSIPTEQKKCIKTFLKCSNFSSKENHKSILNKIYKTAYPKAPYDFEHENFDELKKKLRHLFN